MGTHSASFDFEADEALVIRACGQGVGDGFCGFCFRDSPFGADVLVAPVIGKGV